MIQVCYVTETKLQFSISYRGWCCWQEDRNIKTNTKNKNRKTGRRPTLRPQVQDWRSRSQFARLCSQVYPVLLAGDNSRYWYMKWQDAKATDFEANSARKRQLILVKNYVGIIMYLQLSLHSRPPSPDQDYGLKTGSRPEKLKLVIHTKFKEVHIHTSDRHMAKLSCMMINKKSITSIRPELIPVSRHQ